MGLFYADSSVLVKRHVIETGTEWFQELATQNTIFTSRISVVEVFSTLNRRRRENSVNGQSYSKIVSDFQALCTTEYMLIELTEAIGQRACSILEKYPLRAYDSVQLASALLIHEGAMHSDNTSVVFLSADKRLLDAAKGEKLTIDLIEEI